MGGVSPYIGSLRVVLFQSELLNLGALQIDQMKSQTEICPSVILIFAVILKFLRKIVQKQPKFFFEQKYQSKLWQFVLV